MGRLNKEQKDAIRKGVKNYKAEAAGEPIPYPGLPSVMPPSDLDTLEVAVEQKLVKELKRIGGKAYKFVSPGNTGVPDRLIVHKGRMWLVETKRLSTGLKPRQKVVKQELQLMGIDVIVIHTLRQVENFIELLLGYALI